MKKKILVIEDEELISKNIERLLDLEGFDCVTACDGIEGIDKCNEQIPDLILCDIMMPKLDGFNVLYELKRQHKTKDIPFIFLSAKSDRSSIRLGMEGGADDYIVKPFKTDNLLKSINIQLNKKQEIELEFQEKLNDFQNSFLKNINHEFYTPLNGILGLSSIIIKNINSFSSDKILELIEGINSSGERLFSTLQRFVKYAELTRQISQKETPPPKKLITKELLINRINLIAHKANREQDLTIRIKSCKIRLCEDHMISLIDEIVTNAFKFSSKGDFVIVSTYIEKEHYTISVHNKGVYVSSEEIKTIGPFVQFNRDKLAQQGLGLGLIIAKLITKVNGGNFKMMSSKSQGTEVLIKLPVT